MGCPEKKHFERNPKKNVKNNWYLPFNLIERIKKLNTIPEVITVFRGLAARTFSYWCMYTYTFGVIAHFWIVLMTLKQQK